MSNLRTLHSRGFSRAYQEVAVAVHEELTRLRVMAVVDDLGAQGASGVLEVKGDPSGATTLDGGRIAFAGASWVPGLIPRLSGLRPSPAWLRRLLAEREAEDAAVAALVVQQGCLTTAGLHELIRSIVVDAFLVLVVPLPVNSPVAAIRFTSTRTYWTEMFPRLDIDSVRREAVGRADGIARLRPCPDDGRGAAGAAAAERGADAGAVGGREPDHGGLVGAGPCAAARDGAGRHDRVCG